MFLERVILSGFRCFALTPTPITFDPALTAFVGTNGSGKTALMLALLRLFGVTADQRSLRRQDFHVPPDEVAAPGQRTLFVEAIVAFPELDDEHADHSAIPEFFNQLASDEAGNLKCRLRLDATWTDDGSLDGVIESKLYAVKAFGLFGDDDVIELKAIDRSRIQMIYVPAVRDGGSQVTAFLRGRLWRAISWSKDVRDAFGSAAVNLNTQFRSEPAVEVVATAVEKRWGALHTGGTDTTPHFQPLDARFDEIIKTVAVVFHPDESGRDRNLDDLSDGQRSLFHIAMTAATLDVEAAISSGTAVGFQPGGVTVPALTLIAIEEPENNLAPFYLSRIVGQVVDLTKSDRAQAVLSSHSASILARVDPTQVRHFRLDLGTRSAQVNSIRLPAGDEEASKFVREAVRTYPELYFARFVVLGEGSSEEVVLPRLAEAMGLPIDRSFVAVVPLGGRHVNHLWRLLADLDIPHATLLDLDIGRAGGAWGRVKTAYRELLNNGVAPATLFQTVSPLGVEANLASFDTAPKSWAALQPWVTALRSQGVFFCAPLDLDYAMLNAFPGAYKTLQPGMIGPSSTGDARGAVLGVGGDATFYGTTPDELFRWYRYLFLGRGKPSTHLRALSTLDGAALVASAPEELRALLLHVNSCIS